MRLAYRAWLPALPSAPASASVSVSGSASVSPVVLLHALGEQSADWSAVASALAASRPVYAPDLRGHGASDWPGQYTMAAVTADVAGFFDSLRLRSALVVGHSMGGAAAYQFAARHPDRVSRLILEDPAPPWPLPPRTLTRRPDGPLDFDWDVTALGAELRKPPRSWRDALGLVAAPTLIVAGGPASHVDQDRLAQMASLIPRCELITIPAGHLVHAVRPAEFTAAVTGFLRAERSTRGRRGRRHRRLPPQADNSARRGRPDSPAPEPPSSAGTVSASPRGLCGSWRARSRTITAR